MSRVVVDPVTRIEGHLRIEAEVDGGAVRDAWSSSTMFRGIEIILKGAIRGTPGRSRSASAACAPRSTPSRRFVPSKTRSAHPRRPTRACCAI